jgi:hypothetical protein
MDEEGVLGASVTLKMKESKDPSVEPHKVTICCILISIDACDEYFLYLLHILHAYLLFGM